jgi:hypothetical protein
MAFGGLVLGNGRQIILFKEQLKKGSFWIWTE